MPDGQAQVLVVDDDDSVRRAVARTLRNADFAVVSASSADEALVLLRAGRSFDVIVTDLLMPGTSGTEFIRLVRQFELDTPVIVLTGHSSLDSAILVLEHGGFRYLKKTVDSRTLIAAVREASAQHRPQIVGKQSVKPDDAERPRRRDHAELQAEFFRALAQLWIAFQPIVNWPGQTIFGYEALVRSSEPALDTPDRLIDLAERLGQVEELGAAIRKAVAESIALAPKSAVIFVNLHALDLTSDDLFSSSALLSGHADRVVLEVTERSSLHHIQDLRPRLRALRRLGFRIAVDDLGAGYAGLASFSQLEPDVAKFDMSLIRGIDKSSRKKSIVRSMIAMCTNDLGTAVVCEGVETEAERDTLSDLGAELLQGYLFAQPSPGFRGPSLFARPLASRSGILALDIEGSSETDALNVGRR
jgi:EAL domain-containing protein (putative c-di-GMP-specific phosphodiesterase class I)